MKCRECAKREKLIDDLFIYIKGLKNKLEKLVLEPERLDTPGPPGRRVK